MKQESYFENIHDYLSGQMTDAAKTAFEQEMETNEALRNDVIFEQQLLKGMKIAGDEELKQTIGEVHRKMKASDFFAAKEKPQTRLFTLKTPMMKRVLAIAAAVTLLLVAGWWFTQKEKTAVDTQAAFAQYFKPETTKINAFIDRAFATEPVTPQDSLNAALKLYDNGSYPEAAVALDSFLARHPENDTAKFYLAMSHLNQTHYAKAVELLKPLSEKADFVLVNEAKWYLGLCYLMVDDGLDSAVTVFEDLSKNPEYKDRQAAQGMLRLLKQD